MTPCCRSFAAKHRIRAREYLRIRARGKVFCTGRERAGRDAATIHHESARLIEFKRALRISPLISVAEVQGDAFGFGFGLAIVSDFVYVSENAALGFPEMKFGLAPAAIMAYLAEYALPRFAFPLVLFGDPISPQQAQQIGLISHVSAAASLALRMSILSSSESCAWTRMPRAAARNSSRPRNKIHSTRTAAWPRRP